MTVPQGCFAFDVNQNDVRSDLFDITPRNDIFAGIAPKSEEFPRSRHNDFFQASGTDVEFHIAYKAQSGAVSAVDDFLLTQIAQTHDKILS